MAGGGIGEAALIGAAFGGGASALTGGDPLKGALLGGITGGAGAALPGMLPAATAPIANSMAPTVANAAALNAAAAPTALATAPMGSLGSGTFGILPEATLSNTIPSVVNPAAATQGMAALPGATESPTFFEGLSKIAKNPTEYLMDNRYKLGAAGLAGALGATTPSRARSRPEYAPGSVSVRRPGRH